MSYTIHHGDCLEVMRTLPDNSVDAVVLDPFMGSGSTGHACLLHGRQFIGIEMQAKWCEFAERRLSAVARQGQARPRSIAQNVAAINPRQVTLFDAINDAA